MTIFDYMKNNKLQFILDYTTLDKFEKEAIKQNRSKSNLIRKYVMEGLIKDEEKAK